MENCTYRWVPCKNIQGKTLRELQHEALAPVLPSTAVRSPGESQSCSRQPGQPSVPNQQCQREAAWKEHIWSITDSNHYFSHEHFQRLWTQNPAAMMFHTRTATTKLHATKSYVLTLMFATSQFHQTLSDNGASCSPAPCSQQCHWSCPAARLWWDTHSPKLGNWWETGTAHRTSPQNFWNTKLFLEQAENRKATSMQIPSQTWKSSIAYWHAMKSMFW